MASAPSMSAYSQDLCLVGISGGISTIGFGVSAGTYKTDENCERIKLSKVLSDLGMKVASVSILCQDPRVFFAMEQSGTPCPFEGKIGKAASEQWKKYDKLRPDYAQYTDRLRVVEKAEDEYEQKLKLKEWKDKLDAAEKIRNGDVDVDKTFNQSEAEMIKCSQNTMLASRVALANMIYDACEANNLDYGIVRKIAFDKFNLERYLSIAITRITIRVLSGQNSSLYKHLDTFDMKSTHAVNS